MPQVAASPEVKPLRADARRNREKVLQAARAVFADRGRDAQMDDVAGAAGVGVGTVYRHFPTKEALLEALIVESFVQITDEAERSLEIEDPWEAFATLMWRAAEIMAGDRALSEVFAASTGSVEQRMPTLEELRDAVGRVIERGQVAGVIREDMLVDDVPMIMCGIGSATKKPHVCTEAWRRHLMIVLDGLRARSTGDPLPK
jgi:AcrR family transcriptional regulator